MKCPLDGTDLLMTHRDGIEIDYCPQCRGIWLDRGELDKLIERASSQEVYAARPPREVPPRDYPTSDKRKNDDAYDERYDDDRSYPQGRRRKSFLEDIFDIFD